MKKNLSQFALRMPPELLKSLDDACKVTQSQRTAVVNRLIEWFVGQSPQSRFAVLSGIFADSGNPEAYPGELAELRGKVARLEEENAQLRAAKPMRISSGPKLSPEVLDVLVERGQELATAHDAERIAGILHAIAGEIMPSAPRMAAETKGVKISSPKNKKK